jgi:hypothetical protein
MTSLIRYSICGAAGFSAALLTSVHPLCAAGYAAAQALLTDTIHEYATHKLPVIGHVLSFGVSFAVTTLTLSLLGVSVTLYSALFITGAAKAASIALNFFEKAAILFTFLTAVTTLYHYIKHLPNGGKK